MAGPKPSCHSILGTTAAQWTLWTPLIPMPAAAVRLAVAAVAAAAPVAGPAQQHPLPTAAALSSIVVKQHQLVYHHQEQRQLRYQKVGQSIPSVVAPCACRPLQYPHQPMLLLLLLVPLGRGTCPFCCCSPWARGVAFPLPAAARQPPA